MRLPQELVDAIIDCIGIPHGQVFAENGASKSRRARSDLKSLALVSRACNHRARSHLFATQTVYIHNSLDSFDRCPDVLLGYTRTLTIFQSCKVPLKALLILRRFVSSPLISISLILLHFPEELPEMLKLSFPNVRRIAVLSSLLSPSALLNLLSTLECVGEVRLRGCRLNRPIKRDDNLPSLPPLHGRLSISDPHSTITGPLSTIPLPLRSLTYTSRAFPPEKEIINACAGSLENLEVRMFVDWAKTDFTLDLGRCINLRHMTFVVLYKRDESPPIRPISELLLTLRKHQLSSIRLTAPSQSPFLRLELLECNPPEMRAWERLDQILHKLGVQAEGRGEILTFTFNSGLLVATARDSLADLLPRFNRVGICERITD